MPSNFQKRAKKILQSLSEEYKENKTAFEKDKNFSNSSVLRKKLKGSNETQDNSEE
jgi:hypothetical protein